MLGFAHEQDVLRRIAVDDDEIGVRARRDDAEFAFLIKDFGGDAGRALQDFDGRLPLG